MKQFDAPPAIALPITDTLASIPARNSRAEPDRAVYALRTVTGWVDVTARQFHEEVRSASRGLISRGVGEGSPVAILAPTRYEWTVLDFALWTIGAFAVPIYDSSSDEQIAWIMSDSGAVAVITDSASRAERVRSVLDTATPVWVMDEDILGALRHDGRDVAEDVVDARTVAVRPQDPATIVYTSGTTGRPKGCVISHESLMFVVRTLVAGTQPVVTLPGARTVLFLPLAHVLGRGAQLYCAEGGIKVAHCPDPKMLAGDMASFRPTFLVGVPRIFEKIFNASQQKAHAAGKGKIFEMAAQVAIDTGRARDRGEPSLWLRVQHWVFDRLVYSKLREAMGGHLRYAITGGASLGERLGHFFAGIGVVVMEGYGLTETTASGTFNRANSPRIGSVGQPMAGTSLRVADDGEISLHGPHVMSGYFNNPTATAEVIDADGWFRTGDLGDLDEDGYLRITGRKKEIIVTAGGKNVAPAVLEDRMQAHNLISHAVVVGEGRPFIGALITLDPASVKAWAETKGRSGRTAAELRNDSELLAEVQSAVDDANAAVSKAESIRAWRLLDDEFTEASGHITPTQKVKRAVVSADFGDDIDYIYTH